jgi:hypothetical protein
MYIESRIEGVVMSDEKEDGITLDLSEEDPLKMINFMCPLSLRKKLSEEVKASGRSRSWIIRSALRKYYNDPEFKVEKKLERRFENALEIFNILIKLSSEEEKHPQYWLSFEDVLYVYFSRWGHAKSAISIFSKICAHFRRPLQFEPVITIDKIPGTNKTQKNRRGFNIYFETPITVAILEKLYSKAVEFLRSADFRDILMSHESYEIQKSNKDFSRDMLREKFSGGSDDEEGFETEE